MNCDYILAKDSHYQVNYRYHLSLNILSKHI